MDGSGKTLESGQLKTGDNTCILTIPANTIIRNAAGAAQFSIVCADTELPPAAPPQGAIVMAYDLGPAGVTLNPGITMTLIYTDAQIPAGMPEGSFYIAVWDGAKWVKLASTVDAANNKVTAQVTSFSTFALLAQQPPVTTPPPTTPPATTVPATTVPPTTTPSTTTSPPPVTTPAVTTSAPPKDEPAGTNMLVVGGAITAAMVLALAVFIMSRKKAV
jgi:hypothetical protein